MDILTAIENRAESYLTNKKRVRMFMKSKKRTVFGEIRSWIDALLFAIFWVIIINQYLFQLFLIPSPSMVSTMNIGDRVVVNKDAYGVELYPAGKKIFTGSRRVERDQIITFYNPEYESKGPLFDILSQVVYMGTLTLVNIDKNDDGTPAERLYVKRAVGMPGDTIKFSQGNVLIKPSGTGEFITEEEFRKENNLSEGPNRTALKESYKALEAVSLIDAYYDYGIDQIPVWAINEYNENRQYLENLYDFYEYEKIKSEVSSAIDPSDMFKRSVAAGYRNGIYVKEGYVLPLGDNRDNSHDGRYFGPVPEDRINGRVVFRFWPLNRISVLTDNE